MKYYEAISNVMKTTPDKGTLETFCEFLFIFVTTADHQSDTPSDVNTSRCLLQFNLPQKNPLL